MWFGWAQAKIAAQLQQEFDSEHLARRLTEDETNGRRGDGRGAVPTYMQQRLAGPVRSQSNEEQRRILFGGRAARRRRYSGGGRGGAIGYADGDAGFELPDGPESYERLLDQFPVVTQGLSSAEFDRLPTSTAGTPHTSQDCTVCYDKYAVGDVIVALPCMHLFHNDCAKPWLKDHKTCPVCKKTVDVK